MDDETLVMTERSGVEIDYCPKCRGVWLDRGELDKIVDRATAVTGAAARGNRPPPPNFRSDHSHHEDDRCRGHQSGYGRDYSHKPYKKKKRESFLGELFDF